MPEFIAPRMPHFLRAILRANKGCAALMCRSAAVLSWEQEVQARAIRASRIETRLWLVAEASDKGWHPARLVTTLPARAPVGRVSDILGTVRSPDDAKFSKSRKLRAVGAAKCILHAVKAFNRRSSCDNREQPKLGCCPGDQTKRGSELTRHSRGQLEPLLR